MAGKEKDFLEETIDLENDIINELDELIKTNDYQSIFVMLAKLQGNKPSKKIKNRVHKLLDPILEKIENKTLSVAEMDTILYLLKKEFNL